MSVINVLKISLAFVLAIIAFNIAMHVLGLFAFFLHLAGFLLVLGGISYVIFLLLAGKTKKPQTEKPAGFKLAGTKPEVYLFRSEPKLVDMVKIHDELHLTQLELAGDVFSAPKDSQVIILEDPGNGAVKVKIKNASKKGDAVGWVDKSNVVAMPKLIGG